MEDLKDQMTLSLGIEEQQLSVKDLIVRGEIEQPTTTRRKPKPTPTYERALVDGADCAFRRRCGRKSELLVMLATQGQCYIMDERTGRRHVLTPARLCSFAKDAHGDALTPPWSKVPLQEYGPIARSVIVELFAVRDFLEMVKRDMVRLDAWSIARMGRSIPWNVNGTWEHINLAWRVIEPIVGHERARHALSGTIGLDTCPYEDIAVHVLFRESRFLPDLDLTLGRDRTRELVSGYLEQAARSDGGNCGSLILGVSDLLRTFGALDVPFDPGRLVRHVLRLLDATPSWRGTPCYSLQLWADSLRSQVNVRGHVTEAYPDDPYELLRDLEREEEMLQYDRYGDGVNRRAEELSEHSMDDDKYLIRPVANVRELLDEAEHQHNCLATYLDKYASGDTDIWLMRATDSPDKSLVTVEVRDGRVRQAFQACNRQITQSQSRWLRKWCAECGYVMPEGRMHALCA
ncbi:MAG: PcfJ domain-containing protein [Coriobacteriales bacterium]|nr:PcfJ domain-containing protein [Coriobacteriales bacterium]